MKEVNGDSKVKMRIYSADNMLLVGPVLAGWGC